MEWQPIETAPKDGTVILLSRNNEVYAGWYSKSSEYDVNWQFIDDTKFHISGCCDEENPDLIEPNGFLDPVSNLYWMPLPPPPKE